ncbi:hypothetical protein Kpol_1017p9 [Vanderwaltozyma polyspora DSM 70294]|uniref:Uncharacterized protein n=1 Tax=Vanderwaltozyma polyspora (strain ATCC 22028 / DSM 70294 / BCRC 21397 / CBS 2163 / NBRC 10782 / NRRL Y-8283 / UCD 57-17) TaxID=436907 RepID=A7TRD6_VANPO|nr:uncharacterized protein Kpol_1017p9 [Vanderwaltozyma polyspora DSM 70294]EDO15175.1 hypothetical protein Kpol_1017p9 [Vanderwaltozyma polyspora DSM 70294]
MCILLASRDHPNYDLILISNRDEFLQRRTHETCWNQGEYARILCPYDMSKSNEKNVNKIGTWCGINEFGRVSTILNLKNDDSFQSSVPSTKKSRGALPIKFLDNKETDSLLNWDSYEKFVKEYPFVKETGDFNFFYGDVRIGKYNVIDSIGSTNEVLTVDNPYLVISNDKFGKSNGKSTKEWEKITLAKNLLKHLPLCETEDDLIHKCFDIASTNTLNEDLIKDVDVRELMTETILVPPLNVMTKEEKEKIGASLPIGQYYGTRSQIVILVNKNRTKVKFIERILYNSDDDVTTQKLSSPIQDLTYNFTI